MTAFERFKLAEHVYDVFYDSVESFYNYSIGVTLAYFLGGIIKNHYVNLFYDSTEHMKFFDILFTNYNSESKVWNFVTFHAEDKMLTNEELRQLLKS